MINRKCPNRLIFLQGAKASVLQANAHLAQKVECVDLESEIRERPRFYPHWGNILSLDFFVFTHSKGSDANISIIANVVCLLKPRFPHMGLYQIQMKTEFSETSYVTCYHQLLSVLICTYE